MKYHCDNCSFETDNEDGLKSLCQIDNLADRLDPGGIVPHGECPECGAFVYQIDRDSAGCDKLTALIEAEKYIGALSKPNVRKNFSELNHLEQTLKAVRLAIAKATVEELGNAGCDDCGTYDRVEGSKLCKECKEIDDAVRSVVNGDDDAVHISYSEPESDHRTPLEALRYHVTGAIERGEGVAITEQRADAKITELIRDVKDGDCALSAIFDDGSTRKLFSFFIDELAFFDADLIGKTETEAHQLHHARTIAYIQS